MSNLRHRLSRRIGREDRPFERRKISTAQFRSFLQRRLACSPGSSRMRHSLQETFGTYFYELCTSAIHSFASAEDARRRYPEQLWRTAVPTTKFAPFSMNRSLPQSNSSRPLHRELPPAASSHALDRRSSSPPYVNLSRLSLHFSFRPLRFFVDMPCSAAYFRTSSVIFMEQKCGPHMLQKCAVFAPSCGRVSS